MFLLVKFARSLDFTLLFNCGCIEQAQSKRLKADKELAKIRESWLPAGAPEDQETITDEERVMFRRVGLRMKPYLPLGKLS